MSLQSGQLFSLVSANDTASSIYMYRFYFLFNDTFDVAVMFYYPFDAQAIETPCATWV